MPAVWGLLLMGGCGFSEDRFLVDGVQRWCDAASACAGTFESSACVDRFRLDWEGCTYDAPSGQACFDDLESVQCVEDPIFEVSLIAVPESCDAVYTCPREE